MIRIYLIKKSFSIFKNKAPQLPSYLQSRRKEITEGKQDREKAGKKGKNMNGDGENGVFPSFQRDRLDTGTFLLLYSSGQPLCTQQHPGNDKES